MNFLEDERLKCAASITVMNNILLEQGYGYVFDEYDEYKSIRNYINNPEVHNKFEKFLGWLIFYTKCICNNKKTDIPAEIETFIRDHFEDTEEIIKELK